MAKYTLDSSSLINLFKHVAHLDNSIRKLANAGSVTIAEGVCRELKRGTDKLSKKISKWERDYPNFVVNIRKDHRLAVEFSRIETTYGKNFVVGKVNYKGFWYSSVGKRAADGQVVAIGKVQNSIVVSDDKTIELVCLREQIECIGWANFG